VTMTPYADFLITTSVDGVVKFWKKMAEGIEFVKMFRAHQGEIVGVSVSSDGRSFASAGTDKKVVIFDVMTFGAPAFFTLLLCKCSVLMDCDRSIDEHHPRAPTEDNLLGSQAWVLPPDVGSIRYSQSCHHYL